MSGRDHSVTCLFCNCASGGINDLRCGCEVQQPKSNAWIGTAEQASSARALMYALIYPGRDFDAAWETASLHWGLFGEVPAKLALLEVALLEACDLALKPGRRDKKTVARIVALRAKATGK